MVNGTSCAGVPPRSCQTLRRQTCATETRHWAAGGEVTPRAVLGSFYEKLVICHLDG